MLLDEKSVLEQVTISSRAVNHATDLHRLRLQYVEDEIFVNDQYPVSQPLQPLVFRDNSKLRIRGEVSDGLVELVHETRGRPRAVSFDVLQDLDQVTLCRAQIPDREDRAHFAFSLRRLIMA